MYTVHCSYSRSGSINFSTKCICVRLIIWLREPCDDQLITYVPSGKTDLHVVGSQFSSGIRAVGEVVIEVDSITTWCFARATGSVPFFKGDCHLTVGVSSEPVGELPSI